MKKLTNLDRLKIYKALYILDELMLKSMPRKITEAKNIRDTVKNFAEALEELRASL